MRLNVRLNLLISHYVASTSLPDTLNFNALFPPLPNANTSPSIDL